MDEEKKYLPLKIVEDAIGSSAEETSTKIEIVDAGSRAAELLIPSYGSDDAWTREGRIDYRRFGHIDPIDPYWCTYFSLLSKEQGGGYAQKFVENYANWMYSVDGRHKLIGVEIQKAVSGRESKPKEKKKRSLTDRLLGRNKEDE